MADDRQIIEGKAVVEDAAAPDARSPRPKQTEPGEIREVRSTDLEPYTGLRYLSKLFRFLAVVLVLLLVAEIVTGVYTQGAGSIPTLLGEASRLIVLAGVLWGTGDLAHLLIDVGHDVRAARIMVARVTHVGKPSPGASSGGAGRVVETPAAESRRPAGFADRLVSPRRKMGGGADDVSTAPPIP